LKEKLIRLLNDYYGECRSCDFKEEVADFIEGYEEEIKEVMREQEQENNRIVKKMTKEQEEETNRILEKGHF